MIDFILGDREMMNRVNRMRVGDRVDSDHPPVEVWIKGKEEGRRGNEVKRIRWRGMV